MNGLPPAGKKYLPTPIGSILERSKKLIADGRHNDWWDGTIVRNRRAHAQYRNTLLLMLRAHKLAGRKLSDEYLLSLGRRAGDGWFESEHGYGAWTLLLWADAGLVPESWRCAACEDERKELGSIDIVSLVPPRYTTSKTPFYIECCGCLAATELLYFKRDIGADTVLELPYLDNLGDLVPVRGPGAK